MTKIFEQTTRFALCAALVLRAATAVQAEFLAQNDPKPAVIISTQANDGGWSQAIDEARVKLEGEFGFKIPQARNIPETATAIRPTAELFIDRGANIIIGSAFGYSDRFLELSDSLKKIRGLSGPRSHGFLGPKGGNPRLAG
ncbi:MAG: basic membrane protein A [Paracoccaceae bacterium]|jgi:basic membrane protein A